MIRQGNTKANAARENGRATRLRDRREEREEPNPLKAGENTKEE